MDIFADRNADRFLSKPVTQQIEAKVTEILRSHNIDDPVLHQHIVTEMAIGIAYHRDALKNAVSDLVGVDRYRNMKAFPAVIDICQKVANRASRAMGYRLPFPDHYLER